MFVKRDPSQGHERQMLRWNIARGSIPSIENTGQAPPGGPPPDTATASLASTQTLILAALGAFIGLSVILVVAAVCVYRKRQRKIKEAMILPCLKTAPKFIGSQTQFYQRDQDMKAHLKHVVAMNNTPASNALATRPVRASESSTSTDLYNNTKEDRSGFETTDVYDSDVKDPFYRPVSIPLPAALEKSSRARAAWMGPIKEPNAEIGSPPSYAVASRTQELCAPLPPLHPPRKFRRVTAPPILSTSQVLHSGTSTIEAQVLDVPEQDGQMPVISPARSCSFAVPRSPATPQDTQGALASPHNSCEMEAKLTRMMSVIRPFDPNLDDELPVKVGDILHVFEEYNDGWCFAQQVGSKDAPSGVVPLVCLERKIVPSGPMVSYGV